jgi:hypothetical protein
MKVRKSEGLNRFIVMEINFGRGKRPLVKRRESGYRLYGKERK